MNPPADNDWKPDPQLLAAYFDGELEGRDDQADVRLRLEAWLDQHPQDAAERSEQRQLQKLWLDTTPLEPTAATWEQVRVTIDAERKKPTASQGNRRLLAGAIAAGVALLFGLVYGAMHDWRSSEVDAVVQAPKNAPRPEAMLEILQVATADEVVVTFIEGADTKALVVGRLPVNGPLDLADAGDVRVYAVRFDATTRMQVQQDGPERPLIWMALDDE